MEVDFRGTPRFEVLSRLGAGSSGVVYQAFDRKRDCEVALKALRSRDAVAVQRFREEFAACRSVAHPNLVRFEEMFEDDGQCFFTMELVRGLDLMSYLRPPRVAGARGFDETRVRTALRQLAESLYALHEAGRVHRDVKPSNVRVTAHGRAVLLDLGLVTEIVALASEARDLAVGTPQYCAPEQALGAEPSPAADWYSFGAVLFEALTGRPVFQGSIQRMLEEKASSEAPDPASFVRGLPDDLVSLCRSLLLRDPTSRANGRDVLMALGADVPTLRERFRVSQVPRPRAEMRSLRDALRRSRQGPLHVHVEGALAAGKSRLLELFADAVEGEGALVLRARCYAALGEPLEPWQALSRELAVACQKLSVDPNLTRQAGPLGLMLPALSAVEGIGDAARAAQLGSLVTQRSRAIETLRSILRYLGDQGPLVLVVDDFHAADPDSVALFDALLHGTRGAPLLLLTAGEPLTLRRRAPEVLTLPGRELAEFDERLGNLSEEARTLLRALSVVEHPVPLQLLSEVMHLGGAPFSQALSALQKVELVRVLAVGETKCIEVLHRGLCEVDPGDPEIRELRGRWAVAMHDVRGMPEVHLLRQSGLTVRLRSAARALASRAKQHFSFALQARMLTLSFEAHQEPTDAEALASHAEIGEALTLAGSAAEGARRFLTAAAFAKGADALPLQRRAAELLMQAGQIEEAARGLDDLLRAVDMKPMSSTGWSLASLAWQRSVLAVRGYGYKRRSVQEIVPRKLAEVDVTWSVGQIASTAKTLQGLEVQTRGLRRALSLGEPYRVARALATEASSLAATEAPPQPKARAALLSARKIVDELGDQGLDAACDVAEAVGRFFAADMHGCFEIAARAEAKLRALPNPPAWETSYAQGFTLFAANAFAPAQDALALYDRFVDEARARGDAFAEAMLATGALGYLATMTGRAEEALAAVDSALSAWRETDLHFLHVYQLLSVTHVDLYKGDPVALQRVEALWPLLSRGGLLRLMPLRPFLSRVRGGAMLLTAKERSAAETAHVVRAEAQACARAKGAAGQGMSQILEAGASVLLGDESRAIASLARAEQSFESTGMENWLQAARYHRGRLVGGSEGRALSDQAEAAMRNRGISDPESFARAYATGCSR